jgi:predicted glycoside hydrolase/deacetylase ChbG (UPF0249 family)
VAAEYGREHPALSVGLHVDLGEWTLRENEWVQAYEVVVTDDREAVAREVRWQFDEFRQLMRRDPSHLDSHQHIHRHHPLLEVVMALGAELRVPVRDFTPAISYRGDFYGQGHKCTPFPEGISVENLIEVFRSLPPGITELSCHPGADAGLASSYRAERLLEVKSLCDPCLRSVLHDSGIELISFHNFPPDMKGGE